MFFIFVDNLTKSSLTIEIFDTLITHTVGNPIRGGDT